MIRTRDSSPGSLAYEYPSVTMVIPCRNEKAFIGRCLDSILSSRYPQELLELLVVDGMSDEGTRAIIADYTQQCPGIRLVDNPKITPPAAFNRGISAASGDVVMLMRAHSTVSEGYVEDCVRHLLGMLLALLPGSTGEDGELGRAKHGEGYQDAEAIG